MAPIQITPQDRIFLERLIATEADHKLYKTHPEAYANQVRGVVDTVLNRVASPSYPDTVAGVINGVNQFSAINGPRGRNYTVYGSVQNVPDKVVPEFARDLVNDWVNQRISGVPSSVGGHLNFANPYASDRSNRQWIERLDGPRFGVGQSVHYHGTTAGMKPIEAQVVGDYYDGQRNRLPPEELPQVGSETDTARRVEPVMPTPADQRPPIGLGSMPTPASERPASVASAQQQVRLPELAPGLAIATRPQSFAGQERAPSIASPPVSQHGRALSSAESAALSAGEGTPILDGNGNVTGYEIPKSERRLPEPERSQSFAGQERAAIADAKRSAPLTPSDRPMSYAGQERPIPVTAETAALRVSADTPKLMPDGSVDAPSIHPSESRVPSLPSGRQSYAGQETAKASEPLSYSAGLARNQLALADQSYAGQERAPVAKPSADRKQLEQNTQTYAGSDGPDYPLASPGLAKVDTGRRQLEANQPTYAGNDGPNYPLATSAQKKAEVAVPATSPAEVPKYITTTSKVAVNDPPASKGGVPLGEMTYKTSRDSKDRAEQGKADAAKITERFKTVTVTKLNPEWVAQNPASPTATAKSAAGGPEAAGGTKPAEKKDHGYGLLGDVRQTFGLPAEGIGGAIVGGIRNAFGIPSGGIASGWGGGASKQRVTVGLQPVQRTPSIVSGHVNNGGTMATAVNRSGSSPVTISSGGRSHSESSLSTNTHMNMDVYRANREVLGNNFTQSGIDSAIGSGKTLYK